MSWHKLGAEIIDDSTGRRVLWGGFGRMRGSSMRVTNEEQDRNLRIAAAAFDAVRVAQAVLAEWHGDVRNMQRSEPESVKQARACLDAAGLTKGGVA